MLAGWIVETRIHFGDDFCQHVGVSIFFRRVSVTFLGRTPCLVLCLGVGSFLAYRFGLNLLNNEQLALESGASGSKNCKRDGGKCFTCCTCGADGSRPGDDEVTISDLSQATEIVYLSSPCHSTGARLEASLRDHLLSGTPIFVHGLGETVPICDDIASTAGLLSSCLGRLSAHFSPSPTTDVRAALQGGEPSETPGRSGDRGLIRRQLISPDEEGAEGEDRQLVVSLESPDEQFPAEGLECNSNDDGSSGTNCSSNEFSCDGSLASVRLNRKKRAKQEHANEQEGFNESGHTYCTGNQRVEEYGQSDAVSEGGTSLASASFAWDPILTPIPKRENRQALAYDSQIAGGENNLSLGPELLNVPVDCSDPVTYLLKSIRKERGSAGGKRHRPTRDAEASDAANLTSTPTRQIFSKESRRRRSVSSRNNSSSSTGSSGSGESRANLAAIDLNLIRHRYSHPDNRSDRKNTTTVSNLVTSTPYDHLRMDQRDISCRKEHAPGPYKPSTALSSRRSRGLLDLVCELPELIDESDIADSGQTSGREWASSTDTPEHRFPAKSAISKLLDKLTLVDGPRQARLFSNEGAASNFGSEGESSCMPEPDADLALGGSTVARMDNILKELSELHEDVRAFHTDVILTQGLNPDGGVTTQSKFAPTSHHQLYYAPPLSMSGWGESNSISNADVFSERSSAFVLTDRANFRGEVGNITMDRTAIQNRQSVTRRADTSFGASYNDTRQEIDTLPQESNAFNTNVFPDPVLDTVLQHAVEAEYAAGTRANKKLTNSNQVDHSTSEHSTSGVRKHHSATGMPLVCGLRDPPQSPQVVCRHNLNKNSLVSPSKSSAKDMTTTYAAELEDSSSECGNILVDTDKMDESFELARSVSQGHIHPTILPNPGPLVKQETSFDSGTSGVHSMMKCGKNPLTDSYTTQISLDLPASQAGFSGHTPENSSTYNELMQRSFLSESFISTDYSPSEFAGMGPPQHVSIHMTPPVTGGNHCGKANQLEYRLEPLIEVDSSSCNNTPSRLRGSLSTGPDNRTSSSADAPIWRCSPGLPSALGVSPTARMAQRCTGSPGLMLPNLSSNQQCPDHGAASSLWSLSQSIAGGIDSSGSDIWQWDEDLLIAADIHAARPEQDQPSSIRDPTMPTPADNMTQWPDTTMPTPQIQPSSSFVNAEETRSPTRPYFISLPGDAVREMDVIERNLPPDVTDALWFSELDASQSLGAVSLREWAQQRQLELPAGGFNFGKAAKILESRYGYNMVLLPSDNNDVLARDSVSRIFTPDSPQSASKSPHGASSREGFSVLKATLLGIFAQYDAADARSTTVFQCQHFDVVQDALERLIRSRRHNYLANWVNKPTATKAPSPKREPRDSIGKIISIMSKWLKALWDLNTSAANDSREFPRQLVEFYHEKSDLATSILEGVRLLAMLRAIDVYDGIAESRSVPCQFYHALFMRFRLPELASALRAWDNPTFSPSHTPPLEPSTRELLLALLADTLNVRVNVVDFRAQPMVQNQRGGPKTKPRSGASQSDHQPIIALVYPQKQHSSDHRNIMTSPDESQNNQSKSVDGAVTLFRIDADHYLPALKGETCF